MKQVVFLGVGEACDPGCPNTSLLVETGAGDEVLLDCGFTAAHAYFAHTTDPERLKAVWISHFHGDHSFGLPLLFLRLWEMGRCEELLVVGPHGIQERVTEIVRLAYGEIVERLGFPVRFQEMAPGDEKKAAGLTFRVAIANHTQPALALRLADENNSLYYSGDGRPGDKCLDLASGVALMVHEMYGLEQAPDNHGTYEKVVTFADQAGAGSLALVHLSWRLRCERLEDVLGAVGAENRCVVFVPRPGERFVFR